MREGGGSGCELGYPPGADAVHDFAPRLGYRRSASVLATAGRGPGWGGPRTTHSATAIVTATAMYRMRLLAWRKMRKSVHLLQLGLEIFAIEQIDDGKND